MAGRPIRVISKDDFEKLRPMLSKRWESQNISLAYRMLVLNEKPATLAQEFGVKRQQLTKIENAMWRAYETHMEAMMIPADWVEVTVCLPPETATAVRKIGEKALTILREQLNDYLGSAPPRKKDTAGETED